MNTKKSINKKATAPTFLISCDNSISGYSVFTVRVAYLEKTLTKLSKQRILPTGNDPYTGVVLVAQTCERNPEPYAWEALIDLELQETIALSQAKKAVNTLSSLEEKLEKVAKVRGRVTSFMSYIMAMCDVMKIQGYGVLEGEKLTQIIWGTSTLRRDFSLFISDNNIGK